MTDPTITDAELRDHYRHTTLARIGCTFEHAMTVESVRIALAGAVKAARRIAARRAQDNAIQHQVREAA